MEQQLKQLIALVNDLTQEHEDMQRDIRNIKNTTIAIPASASGDSTPPRSDVRASGVAGSSPVTEKGIALAIESLKGEIAGQATAYNLLPTTDPQGSPLEVGDYALLARDDVGAGDVNNPQYPAGFYRYDGASWVLAAEIDQTKAGLAAEILAGTDTENKSWSAKELHDGIDDKIAEITRDILRADGVADDDSIVTEKAVRDAIEAINIAGDYQGSDATFAGLPTTGAINGDWAILTADDGANVSGIYVYDGTTYTLAKALDNFVELTIAQATDQTDTTMGLVSGELLEKAVTEFSDNIGSMDIQGNTDDLANLENVYMRGVFQDNGGGDYVYIPTLHRYFTDFATANNEVINPGETVVVGDMRTGNYGGEWYHYGASPANFATNDNANFRQTGQVVKQNVLDTVSEGTPVILEDEMAQTGSMAFVTVAQEEKDIDFVIPPTPVVTRFNGIAQTPGDTITLNGKRWTGYREDNLIEIFSEDKINTLQIVDGETIPNDAYARTGFTTTNIVMGNPRADFHSIIDTGRSQNDVTLSLTSGAPLIIFNGDSNGVSSVVLKKDSVYRITDFESAVWHIDEIGSSSNGTELATADFEIEENVNYTVIPGVSAITTPNTVIETTNIIDLSMTTTNVTISSPNNIGDQDGVGQPSIEMEAGKVYVLKGHEGAFWKLTEMSGGDIAGEDRDVTLIDVDASNNTTYPFSTGETWADVKANYDDLRFDINVSDAGVQNVKPFSIYIPTDKLELFMSNAGWALVNHHGVQVWINTPSNTSTGFTYRQSSGDAPTNGRMQFRVTGIKKAKTVVRPEDEDRTISTTEVNTGRQWQGKDIFRVELNKTTAVGSPEILLNGVDKVLDIQGTVSTDGNSQVPPVFHDGTKIVRWFLNTNTLSIAHTGFTSVDGYNLVVEYIKQ